MTNDQSKFAELDVVGIPLGLLPTLLLVPFAGASEGTPGANLADLAFLGARSLVVGTFFGCLSCTTGDASLAALVRINAGGCIIGDAPRYSRPQRVSIPRRVDLGPKERVTRLASVD
ncbi:hypothetical protein DFJ58DRAFT_847584 [Suillus subalutaceus]|uniref:uncharacterized protein n=1 Tax=Suillus subalutaceus TaxID=48586 RepID=UPI001B88381E|nr:uncharacterized protein DFJ58DRAFT_847584 [Suillus subalutaceus]KAG1834616.1 hypothetical protein DFJ58DRAFT_847584 [Suillus subalutaceus]